MPSLSQQTVSVPSCSAGDWVARGGWDWHWGRLTHQRRDWLWTCHLSILIITDKTLKKISRIPKMKSLKWNQNNDIFCSLSYLVEVVTGCGGSNGCGQSPAGRCMLKPRSPDQGVDGGGDPLIVWTASIQEKGKLSNLLQWEQFCFMSRDMMHFLSRRVLHSDNCCLAKLLSHWVSWGGESKTGLIKPRFNTCNKTSVSWSTWCSSSSRTFMMMMIYAISKLFFVIIIINVTIKRSTLFICITWCSFCPSQAKLFTLPRVPRE